MFIKSIAKSATAVSLSAVMCMGLLTGCHSSKKEENTTETTTEEQQETQTQPVTQNENPENTTTDISDIETPSGENGMDMIEYAHRIEGQVVECGRVDKSYFDDVAFVGDSISNYLGYYATATGALGNATFLTSGSLSATNALWEISEESVHPRYNGEKMLIEDAVAACGAKKLYIMLGMNDLGINTLDEAEEKYRTLLDKITEKSPGIQICIESMTPMLRTERALTDKYLNNDNIAAYNERLNKMCQEKGWYFINVASVFYAQDGFLKADYCSDPTSMGIHPSNAGCDRWIDYLYTHTPQEEVG